VISPDKDIRKLVRELERAGFEVSKKGNKHIKVRNIKTNQQISIPSTPSSNGRQRLNMFMSLRSIGFDDSVVRDGSKKKKKEEINV
jgi:hypothetical protein